MSALFKRTVSVLSALSVSVSVHLTAIERLRGEWMCANIAADIWRVGDNAQEIHRQRKRRLQTVMINCSEMRTEGTW